MITKDLGRSPYLTVYQAMQAFTVNRQPPTQDELWLVEHDPVFTQGVNGKAEHIIQASDIPVVQTDRGGQITYHGHGQLVAYTLIDLKRAGLGIRKMVTVLENSIISLLSEFDIMARARPDAPGVYVDDNKIASVGLKVKRGACYHGVSFNLDMDLTPFSMINPCGYAGQKVTDLASLGHVITIDEIKPRFESAFRRQMEQ